MISEVTVVTLLALAYSPSYEINSKNTNGHFISSSENPFLLSVITNKKIIDK